MIGGAFMNPTGNYHMPVKYFLESNGNDVYVVEGIHITSKKSCDFCDNSIAMNILIIEIQVKAKGLSPILVNCKKV